MTITTIGMWTLTDEQVTAALVDAFKAKSQVEARAASLMAVAQDRGLVCLAGASSDTAWLAQLTGVSRSEASKTARMAEQLDAELEPTRREWESGDLTTEKASTIMRAINTLPEWVGPAERDAAQSHLLDLARRFSSDHLKRLANHIVEVIDPDGAEEHLGKKLEEQERRSWLKTDLSFQDTGEGFNRIRATIPTLQAGMLRAALEGLASPRRNSAQIWDRDGDHCDAANGTLTHAMRLGRALCELIEHLPTEALPQHGGLAATVTVNIDFDALKDQIGTATVSTGHDMSASQARRFACNARILPMVLGGKSKILDLGTSKRLFDTAQRLVLEKRDQGCCWPGCDRPAAWTEAHHLTPYSAGGPTNLINAALFCPMHHHLLHEGRWHARMSDDGAVEVIPPTRIDPDQKPLRHERFSHGPRRGRDAPSG